MGGAEAGAAFFPVLILLLVGGKRAKRAANPEHPFGYTRERYIYAFIVSIVLFSVGGLFALYEAWEKLRHPHAIEGDFWWVPLAVLVGAIMAESFPSVRQSSSPTMSVGSRAGSASFGPPSSPNFP